MPATSRSLEKTFHPVVLIPAYKPDVRLPQLVELLQTVQNVMPI
jgi:hypothetical protein